MGIIGYILGLYGVNGKENRNYYTGVIWFPYCSDFIQIS